MSFRGVQQPPGPRTSTPNRLLHVERAEMFGVAYADENGQEHTTIAVRIGDAWYLPPNGESWAATLVPLRKDAWLVRALHQKIERPATQPAESVDILR